MNKSAILHEINSIRVRICEMVFKKRNIITLMLFSGMIQASLMRNSTSIAIVAMVNHTAILKLHFKETFKSDINNTQEYATTTGKLDLNETFVESDFINNNVQEYDTTIGGTFSWDIDKQAYILSSFLCGYTISQIPFGLLAKYYGAVWFLGTGMLIISLLTFLVPVSAHSGIGWLIGLRIVQGIIMGCVPPCANTLLAKWIPPSERSRMASIVYSGTQVGTFICMPICGLLSASAAGWPSIFYTFGVIGTVWSIIFLFIVYENPSVHPSINEDEKNYILSSVCDQEHPHSAPIPWKAICKSLPFWAILIAHIGQNYAYETLVTELPTFMKQILNFSIQNNGMLGATPYFAMFIFSVIMGYVSDWMLRRGFLSATIIRRINNGIGQYSSGIALIACAFISNKWLTVAILIIGVGLNGGINAGFKVNHLDISPRYAGILMALTNCFANVAGFLAPIYAGNILKAESSRSNWAIIFLTAGIVHIICCSFFVAFSSGEQQSWNNPQSDIEMKCTTSDSENVQKTVETSELSCV